MQNDFQTSPADASEDSTLFHPSHLSLALLQPHTSVLGTAQNRGPPTEIVLIDSSLKHDFQLENTVPSNVLVAFFAADAHGIHSISKTLSHYTNLSAIHIVSHGAPGELTLGTERLNNESLDIYSNAIRIWGNALAPEGDILLYGCSVGQGQVGRDFAQQVAELSGADVATSDNPTGNKGIGDWELELKIGEIQANSGFVRLGLRSLDQPLATYTVNSTADNTDLDGEVTLRESIEAANTNAQVGDALAGSNSEKDIIQFGSTVAGARIVLLDSITVVLSEDTRVHPESVSEISSYSLTASGLDSSFGDGNELDRSNLIAGIVWNEESNTITLSMNELPFEDELYQLNLSGVHDIWGNFIANDDVVALHAYEMFETFVWKSDTDGSWHDASNWHRGVPTVGADVLIDKPGVEVTVGSSITVDELQCSANLTINSGTFLVQGASLISGQLYLAKGTALRALGPEAVLEATGAVTLESGDLYAWDGGKLILPGLTECQLTTNGRFEAKGQGSLLELSNVTQIDRDPSKFVWATIKAYEGGEIRLSSLTEMSEAWLVLYFYANDSGSVIDLSSLFTYI